MSTASTTASKSATSVAGGGRAFEVLALSSFVALGLPDGMLGTAWPAMRASFGVPVADLGLVLVAGTAGAAVITAVMGRLLHRCGISTVVAAAGLIAALGATGIALSPSLGVVIAVAVLPGIAAGLMDGGLNTAVGLMGRARLLNLLHGAYGVGTALGPLLVSAAILAGSWRPSYGVLLLVDLAVAAGWILLRRRSTKTAPDAGTPTGPPAGTDDEVDPTIDWRRRRVFGVVTVGMVVFFLYTGLEVTAGQWETSFGRGTLHLSAGQAGLASFGYWGALTAARLGLAVHPVRPHRVIRWGVVGSLISVAAVAARPVPVVAVIGFVVLGAALGGIFPALVALTPGRVGARRAHHVIAWQVGAAAVGGPGLSALVGLLVARTSLAVIGPTLAVLAVLLAVALVANARTAPRT